MRTGVYPGTFDPIHNGHLDLIRRSLQIFDRIIVAVAPNPKKAPLFPIAERVEMLRAATRDLKNVEVEVFEGLLADFIHRRHASAIVRGLRAISDFEHEFLMALMNRKLDSDAETVFLMPSVEYTYLTSSAIKEVASYGGDLKDLVPPQVAERLRARFPHKA
jgi:pantetheine-phosphate adenylyltransferase